MGLDVADLGSEGIGDAGQRVDLRLEMRPQHVGRDVDGAPPEPGRVQVGDVGTDGHPESVGDLGGGPRQWFIVENQRAITPRQIVDDSSGTDGGYPHASTINR